jgi:hypothetical protein
LTQLVRVKGTSGVGAKVFNIFESEELTERDRGREGERSRETEGETCKQRERDTQT